MVEEINLVNFILKEKDKQKTLAIIGLPVLESGIANLVLTPHCKQYDYCNISCKQECRTNSEIADDLIIYLKDEIKSLTSENITMNYKKN